MATMKKAQSGVVVSRKDEKANPNDFKYLRKSEKAASDKAIKSKVKPKEMMKKVQNSVKTADSTAYFSKKADSLSRSMKKKNLKGDFKGGSKDLKGALGALKDEYRQGNKGQSGYDKNGYPLKKKAKTGASIKKCKYGCN